MRLRNWIIWLVVITLATPLLWWAMLTTYPPRQSGSNFYLGLWVSSTDNGAYPWATYGAVVIVAWSVYLLVLIVKAMNDRAARKAAEVQSAKQSAGAVAHQSLMP
jgi:hypothetical protein